MNQNTPSRPLVEPKPLYRQIAEVLREEIQQTKSPGDRLDAESTIAARFKVTVMTVREALRTLQQEGFIERQHGRGSFVADTSSTRAVAILSEQDLTHPSATFYHRHIVHVVRREIEKLGYTGRIFLGRQSPIEASGDLNCSEFFQELKRGTLVGVVAVNSNPDPAWMDVAREQNLPVVGNPNLFEYGEAGNSDSMIETGVRHLVERGRKKIAFLEWRNPTDNPISRNLRQQAFRRALAEAALEPEEGWIQGDLNPHMSGAGWAGFREIWTHSRVKPDGILIADDVLFRDAKTAIIELGIQVPEDLAIVTHANRGKDFICPFPVTRLEFDPEEIAMGLVKMIVSLLRGERLAVKKRYHPFRVVESAGSLLDLPALEDTSHP